MENYSKYQAGDTQERGKDSLEGVNTGPSKEGHRA
jgi:hypothetical protein